MTRVSLALVSATLAVAGCKHRLAVVPCDAPCPPVAAATAACPPADAPPAPAPQVVEVRGTETIRVKAPTPKVTVVLPPECPLPGAACQPPPTVAAGPAPGYAPAPAPGFAPAPGYAPAPGFAPAPGYAPAAGYAPAGLMSSTQTVKPRTRIAMGFDTIRIPFPCPKLFAVQGEQEVVTRQTFQAPAAAPMAFAPAPMAFAPAAAPVAYAPAAAPVAAPVAYAPAPQPQMMYAPAPQPQMMYAPQPQPAPPIQGMICVPTPGCLPACPTPAAPCPDDCPPAGPTGAAPLLRHLDQVQQRLDVMEQNYRTRTGVTPAGAAVPGPLAPAR